MPACDARYDVIYGPAGGAIPDCTSPHRAVVDMDEERLPDVWGEPGRLVSAKLRRWWASNASTITYGRTASRKNRLWVDGSPRTVYAGLRYVRWAWIEPEPPVDPIPDEPP